MVVREDEVVCQVFFIFFFLKLQAYDIVEMKLTTFVEYSY